MSGDIFSLDIIQDIKGILFQYIPENFLHYIKDLFLYFLQYYLGLIGIRDNLMPYSIVANIFIIILKPFKLYLVIDARIKLILLICIRVNLNKKYFKNKFLFYIEKNLKFLISYISNNIYIIYISNVLYKLLILCIFILKPVITIYNV